MFLIKNKNSIIRKLLIPMVIVVLAQVVLFVSVVLLSGIVGILKNNSFNLLNQKIQSRGSYIQNEMIQHWSNVSESESLINANILHKLHSKGITVKDLDSNTQFTKELLEDVSSNLIFMLRKNYVTGAFLILDNNSEEKVGLYFRDLDPNSNPSDKSDLLMERGPASIAQNLGIPLDTWWNNRFIFNQNKNSSPEEFFSKPINAAVDNKGLSYKDLGYWSKPFSLSDKDIQIVTYSVPLLDENGKPYGVLGIAISLNYLNSLLSYDEIDSNGRGVYLVGVDDNKNMNFEKITTTGPLAGKILGEEKIFSLIKRNI